MTTHDRNFEIRRLTGRDARPYRAVLIEALIVHPDCFPEDYNSELARPLADIERALDQNLIFGMWTGDHLSGIAAVFTCEGSKRRHSGRVRGVYVKTDFRRRGAGSALLENLI